MNGTNGYRALADGPGDTFHGAVPNVASRKHTRQARFEWQRRATQWPRLRWNVPAGQDECTLAQLDDTAEPFCAGLGADQYEDGRGSDLFPPSSLDILQGEPLEAGFAVRVDNSHVQPDLDIGEGIQVRDQVVRHARGQTNRPVRALRRGQRTWPDVWRPGQQSWHPRPRRPPPPSWPGLRRRPHR